RSTKPLCCQHQKPDMNRAVSHGVRDWVSAIENNRSKASNTAASRITFRRSNRNSRDINPMPNKVARLFGWATFANGLAGFWIGLIHLKLEKPSHCITAKTHEPKLPISKVQASTSAKEPSARKALTFCKL